MCIVTVVVMGRHIVHVRGDAGDVLAVEAFNESRLLPSLQRILLKMTGGGIRRVWRLRSMPQG